VSGTANQLTIGTAGFFWREWRQEGLLNAPVRCSQKILKGSTRGSRE
jgi:hypothetical protein